MPLYAFRIPLLLVLVVFSSHEAQVARAETEAPAGTVLAWIRFDDAAQEDQGTRYRFLGDGTLQLAIDVGPSDGHVFDLLWGSKNDARSAAMVVNGRTLLLEQGNYDGFRWLRVPVPPGVSGERYDVLLSAGKKGTFRVGEATYSGGTAGP